MMQRRQSTLFAVLLFSCGSCSLLSPQPDPTRFALLASVDELPGAVPPPAQALNPLRLGLGPIEIPEYLRRAALVTREHGTRLSPSPSDSWGEPFERSVERVLTIDLQRELGTGQPLLHPWYETDRPDVQIELAFSRCERDANGNVVVACRWIARWLDLSRAPIERESRLERPIAGKGGAAVALAISESIAELCKEISTAVRESPTKQ